MGQLFDIIFVTPLTNLLIAIYHLLVMIHLPYALGFSIIALTLLIRFILAPFTAAQLRTSRKLQEIQPHLNKLKEKHKNDAKRLQQETMQLYKEHGVSPLGGCLPTLVQLLLFPALYGVLRDFVTLSPQQTMAKFNSKLYFPILKLHALTDPTFFGLPLGKSPAQLLHIMPVILLVPLVTAGLQLLQSKMLFATSQKPVLATPAKDKKDDSSDFQAAMQTQMTYFLPVMIGFMAYNFPIGLALYWNTFTIFAMIQQYMMHGWGGLAPWIEKMRSTQSK